MSLYKNTNGEIREIGDALMAAWVEAENPKTSQWTLYVPPAPAPRIYTRADYKSELDGMLQHQCTAHAGYEFDSIESAATWISLPSKFQAAAIWLCNLRTFVWETSDAMATQPPSENPPTPDQLAAYLLSGYIASHPFPS